MANKVKPDGKKIAKRRHELGYSQEEFCAKFATVSRPTLSDIERGVSVTGPTLRRVAKAMGLTFEEAQLGYIPLTPDSTQDYEQPVPAPPQNQPPESSNTTIADYFTVMRGQELQPVDLLGRQRVRSFREYYLEREEVDGQMSRRIARQESFIITGKPLSGKSRAILNQLNNLFPESCVYLATTRLARAQSAPSIHELDITEETSVFFVFNDMERFVETDGFDDLVMDIMELPNAIIIASCRKEVFSYVQHSLGARIAEDLSVIEIPPLTDQYKTELRKNSRLNEDNELAPDDTVGSYFFPLKAMKQIYDDMHKRENGNKYVKEREILRSYKCVDLWRNRNKGNKDIIFAYAQKRLENIYGEMRTIYRNEWDNALNLLIDQGFVQDHGETISIEYAYLSNFIKIHVPEDKNEEHVIALEVLSYYPLIEHYSRLIARVSTPGLYKKLYQDMIRKKINPDHSIFAAMIKNSGDIEEALEILIEMRKFNVKETFLIMTQLLKKTPLFDLSFSFLQKMKLHFPLNEFIFYNLLKKARYFDEVLDLHEEMLDAGITPNEKFFPGMSARATMLDEHLYVCDHMYKAGFLIHRIILNRAINATNGFPHAFYIYEQYVDKLGKRAIKTVFNALISKADKYADADSVINHMVERDISPSKNNYNTLMTKAPDFKTAWDICERMEKEGTGFDAATFDQLVSRADTFKNAWRGALKMREYKVTPEWETIIRLAEKATIYREAKLVYNLCRGETDIYSLMQKQKEFSRRRLLHRLILKDQGFSGAYEVMTRLMKEESVKPTKRTVYILLEKANSKDKEKKLSQQDQVLEFFKDTELYVCCLDNLIGFTDTYSDAVTLLQKVINLGGKPHPGNFHFILSKTKIYSEAKYLYDHMKLMEIEINERFFRSLMMKSKFFYQVVEALKLMEKEGINPSKKTIKQALQMLKSLVGGKDIDEYTYWYNKYKYSHRN